PMPPMDEVWSGTLRYSIVRVQGADDAVLAVRGETLDVAATRAMQVRAMVRDWIEQDEQQVRLVCTADLDVLEPHQGVAFGFAADLLCDGVVVASFRFDDRPLQMGRRLVFNGSVVATHDGTGIDADPSRWSVRIRGDATESLRWVDCDRYWAGEFSVPMERVME
ncbi:MAG: hypothetical protein KIS87_12455, partial [Phycisphaeraceae bacterium]|nr:hypothetical protein [Phycisphaeraceae bacterium]